MLPAWAQIALAVASPLMGLLVTVMAWVLSRQIARIDALKETVDARTEPLTRYDERIKVNQAAIGGVDKKLTAINEKLDRLLEGRR